MLKTQRTDEAIRILSLENSLNNELKEFFQNFDAIFLSIFPTFIEEFNEMLIENERIYPKEKDILTPELRIYALIRLGINDSARIAELLHYSPQTVYNYKIKIKNKLAISKEEFSEKILVIGR
jgi:DNA-binding CsgD family transcriptional regulator